MAVTASQGRWYLVLLGLILIAVGGINVAAPPPSLVSIAQVVNTLLVIFGVVGLAMAAAFGTVVSGLTNTQRAYLTFIATLATGLGSINVMAFGFTGASLWYLQLILMVLGVIGLTIEKAIGIALTAVSKSV